MYMEKEIKLSLLINDMIFYIEKNTDKVLSLEKWQQRFLELSSDYSKIKGCKINI